MRLGKFDRQISVYQKSVTTDPDYGTQIITWAPLDPDSGSPTIAVRWWAEVQDAMPSRSEAVTQGLTLGRDQTRIRTRWRGDMTSSMRITVHGDATDEIYDIVGGPADVDGRKRMIEVVCEKYSS